MASVGVIVIDPGFFFRHKPLMNHLLYFDRLSYSILEGYQHLDEIYSGRPETRAIYASWMQEMEMLDRYGLLSEHSALEWSEKNDNLLDTKILEKIEDAEKLLALISVWQMSGNKEMSRQAFNEFAKASHLLSRANSQRLNKSNTDINTPILSGFEGFIIDSPEDKTSNVVKLVIDKFPLLGPEAEIERIVEFKSDVETHLKLQRIRVWISELGKKNLSIPEVEQSLEHLLAEYEKHLRIHNMKFKTGVFQTVILPIADIIENLIQLKPAKAMKSFLEVRMFNLNLLEAEQKAPGKEVAYIAEVNSSFTDFSKV